MFVNMAWLALIPSVLFILTGFFSLFQKGMRPFLLRKIALGVGFLGILASIAASVNLFQNGVQNVQIWNWMGWGISFRMDALSILMLTMISLLAFIILQYSANYLDGDSHQGSFIGRLAITFASVELLVLSGNLLILALAWVLTSISLHTLLTFYPERKAGMIAAKKKFILARIGDACLLSAFYIIYISMGTAELSELFLAFNSLTSFNSNLVYASVLICIAALLKSAQFPTWGWLVEVMETPTPVSALLHAGILNAGPYLVVRFASLMQHSEFASIVLVGIGGLTALLASVCLLTQPSIKVALAYSSAAHMGFMLLVCGLGVYPAVMLHLVAHSFYKAHAFLSSGSIVDSLRSNKVQLPARLGSIPRLVLSLVMAIGIYGTFAYLWGIDFTESQDLPLLGIGFIFVLGLTLMISPALDSDGSILGTIRTVILALATTTAFFGLESLMHSLLQSEVPGRFALSELRMILLGFVLVSFLIAIFAQAIAPSLAIKKTYRAWSLHFRNGLYVNAYFDRIIGSLRQNTIQGESHV
ncbi:MAG: hypothetical protein MH321_00980 [Leptospiraceae bacterium]|nr:hypothetical protein [Leptospiraceae bacterium]